MSSFSCLDAYLKHRFQQHVRQRLDVNALIALIECDIEHLGSDIAEKVYQLGETHTRVDTLCATIAACSNRYNQLCTDFGTKCSSLEATLVAKLEQTLRDANSKSEYIRSLAPFAELVQRFQAIDRLIEESVEMKKQCKYALSVAKINEAIEEEKTICQLLHEKIVDSYLTDEADSVLRAIETDTSLIRESLLSDCRQIWNKIFHFKSEFDVSQNKGMLIFSIDTVCNKIDFGDLLKALDELSLLQALVFEFGDFLMENILEPYRKDKIEHFEVSENNIRFLFTNRNETHVVSPCVKIKKIELIFYYITVATSKSDSSLFVKYFARKAEKIFSWVMDEIVIPSMPTDQTKLPEYQKLLETTSSFENTLIVNGFLSEKSPKLDQLLSNLTFHFVSKVFQNILVKARKLIKRDFYPVEEVGCHLDTGVHSFECKNELDERFPCFSHCKVSQSMIILKELIRETIAEFLEKSAEFRIGLFKTVLNVFELYIVVSTRIHRNDLLQSPVKVALFYNNCLFLAHELLSLSYDYEEQLQPAFVNTFVDLVPILRELGSDYLLNFLKKQKSFHSLSDLQAASNKLISSYTVEI